jgi:hypothetical protein
MLKISLEMTNFLRLSMQTFASHVTTSLIHPFSGPGQTKLLADLAGCWASTFREEILPKLPVEKVAKLYCPDNGRPTKNLRTMIALMVIQEFLNLTCSKVLQMLRFNMLVHWALGLDEISDANNHVCLKTYMNFRRKIIEARLDKVIFDDVVSKLVDSLKVDTDTTRLDSVQIKSNMKTLSRSAIFSKCLTGFLRNLDKNNKEAFAQVDPKIVEKYYKKGEKNTGYDYFGKVTPSQREKTLQASASDMFILVEQFKEDPKVSSMQSYSHMERVMREQCKIIPTGEDSSEYKVELKPSKEVPSDSLQNPSDEDATNSFHKGQGYHAQLPETCAPGDERRAPTREETFLDRLCSYRRSR